LFALGRVTEAEAQYQEAITLTEMAPRGLLARRDAPFFWIRLAGIAAQRGDRRAAEQALGGATRAQAMLSDENQPSPFGRQFVQEFVERCRRGVLLTFHEYEDVERAARESLVRLSMLSRVPGLAVTWKEDIEDLQRAAWIDIAKAALELRRFAAAEDAARTATTGAQGNGYVANLETNRAFAHALLALAMARQGRAEEARVALAPALGVFRDLRKKGAEGIEFSHGFAFGLYVQAIASNENASGLAQRVPALDEAEQLLAELSEEAKSLRDVRELIEWIARERARS
jgi:hypothetical protein